MNDPLQSSVTHPHDFAGEQDPAAARLKPKQPEPVLILNRAMLRAELSEPIPFVVRINDRPLSIPLKRLSAVEMEQVNELFDFMEGRCRSVQPPPITDRAGSVTGYDDRNSKYREQLSQQRRKARAWAIWLACAAVRESDDGHPGQDQAVALVDNLLPEVLQEKMLAAIINGGMSIGDRVDFLSDDALAQS